MAIFLAFGAGFSAIEVNLSYPENNSWTNLDNSSLNFTFNMSGEFQEAVCLLWLEGSLAGTVNATNNTDTNITSQVGFSLGNNSWLVSCSNSTTEGNSTELIFNFDNVSPVSNQLNPENAYNSSQTSINFTAMASDNLNLSTVSLWGNFTGTWSENSTNNSFVNGSSWNFSVSGLSEGFYTWAVYSNDSSGNYNFSENLTLTVDRTAPSLSGTPLNNTFYVANTSFTIAFGESVNLSWISNSTSNITNSSGASSISYNSILPTGSYSWTVYARDFAGNVNSTAFNFSTNRTRPYINITKPISGNMSDPFTGLITNETHLNFTFNVTEETNSSMVCAVYLDGARNDSTENSSVINSTETTIGISGIAYGDHYWYVGCSNGVNTTVSENRTFSSRFLNITHTQIPNQVSHNTLFSINSSLLAYGGAATNASLSVSLPSGWTIVSNSTDGTGAPNQYSANNSTLSFGSSFWLNLTIKAPANQSGNFTITTSANSSEGHPLSESHTLTLLNISANSTFSPASVNSTATGFFNLTIGNNALSYSANITSFNFTFNQTDFNVTSASNLSTGWSCTAGTYWFNCSGGNLTENQSAVFNITLRAGKTYGNRTGTLLLFDSLGGNSTFNFSSPQILAPARVSANITSITNSTSRLVNFTFSQTGLLTVSNFTGNFPSGNFSSLNVVSNSNLSCENLTANSFYCNGTSGNVVLNLTASGTATIGPVNATFYASNATEASIPLEPIEFTVTKPPQIWIKVYSSASSVSLSSNTTLYATVINCNNSAYCAPADDIRIYWKVDGLSCDETFPTGYYNFDLSSQSPVNLTANFTTPSQSKRVATSAASCKYYMNFSGFSNDTGSAISVVYVDNATVSAVATTTTVTTTTAPAAGPGGLPGITTPYLSFSVSPSSVAMNKGSSRQMTATVLLKGTSSVSSALSLAVNGSVSSSCCSVSISPSSYPSPITNTTSKSFTVTLTVPSTASPGSYQIRLTTSAGSYSNSTNLTIVILSDSSSTTTTVPLSGANNTTASGNGTIGNGTIGNGTSGGIGVIVNITPSNSTADLERLFLSINSTATYFQSLRAKNSSENLTVAEEKLREAIEYYERASDAIFKGNETAYSEFLASAKKAFSEAESIAFGIKVKTTLPLALGVAGAILAIAVLSGLVVYFAKGYGKGSVLLPKQTVSKTKKEMSSVLEEFSREIREPIDKRKTREPSDGEKGGKGS